MVILCCNPSVPSTTLSDIGSISQAIVAAISLFLAGYIFIYQRNLNSRAEVITTSLNEQNIRLQLFREFVLQPNFQYLNLFYKNLEELKSKITTDDLSEDDIVGLNRYINDEAKKFRVTFNDAIFHIDKDLYELIKKDIENLVTQLTVAFSDNEHKFTNAKTFEKLIISPIRISKHNVISYLYNFRGI